MSLSILVLTLVVAGDGRDDPKPKNDKDHIQGKWDVRACRIGGQELTSPDGPHLISFEAKKMFITRDGKRAAEGLTFTLDPTKSPRTIDLKDERFEYRGIYEFDGQHLRVCYNQKKRPTRFDAEEQKDEPFNVLYELERK